MQRAAKQILIADITTDTAADPTAAEGTALADFGYGDKVPDAIDLLIRVTGTSPTGILSVLGRDRALAAQETPDLVWADCGENGATLNFGQAITRSCKLTIRDVGAIDRIFIKMASIGGAGARFRVYATALINEVS